MSSETLQILIGVVGVFSQLILLSREITKLVDASSKDHDGKVARHLPATFLAKIQRGKSVLDLSFVILCAAFFSLLTTDSLIVSGRNPATGPFNIFLVILITLIYVGILLTAWYINKTEMVVGFLAIITLAVLIISPGGPFNKETDGVESGLNIFLIVPVAALITISATMLIYSFGSPLSRTVDRKRRIIVFVTLVVVGLFAAVAIGRQVDDYIAKDARTPKFSTPEVKTFARSVLQQPLEEKRAFYRYASEICLTDFYRNAFDNTQPEQPQTVATPAPAPSPAKSPGQTQATATPSASPASSSVSPEQRRQIELTTVSDIRRAYSNSSATSIYSFLSEYEDTITKAYQHDLSESEQARLAKSRMELLVGKFKDSLDITQKLGALRDRLNWIHPVGIGRTSDAAIPLPDKTAKARLAIISKYRLISVLHDQEKQRTELFREFSYPDEVRSYYMDDAERLKQLRATYGYYPPSDIDRNATSAYYKPNLFPSTFTNNGDLQIANFLKEQLSLPLDQDAAIVYQEYRAFAAQQVKQRLQTGNTDKWILAFTQLNPKSHQALYYSLLRQGNLGTDTVLTLLSKLKANGTDFSEFINSSDPFRVRKIRDQLTANPPAIEQNLEPLARKLRELDANDKKTLATLLQSSEFSYTGPSFPVEYLFTDNVLTFISEIGHDLDSSQQKEFLTALLDPIWYSIGFVSNQPNAQSAQGITDPRLETFRSYSREDQENILHQLAISLYQPGGPHSFDPIRLLIAQVRFWSDTFGWISATILCIPLLVGLTLLGAYFARLLIMRDRMREIVASEHSEFTDVRNTLGTPVELFGRTSLIRTLKNLAERGWSTIGVVGRRGVGKSRVLHALSVSDADGMNNRETDESSLSIRVWVSSPSKFTEEEFISSIYERLALSTESAIANFLGAKPLATRMIENKMAISSMWGYGIATLLLTIIVYYMSNRLSRTDIVAIWIPILVLVFTSLGLFVHYISKLQPVNLTSWLQREKSQNPHTYLLYRDVYKVLGSLKLSSFIGHAKESVKGVSGIGKSIVLGILTFVIAGTSLWLAIAIENPVQRGWNVILWAAILVLFASVMLWLYYFRKTEKVEGGNWTTGQTLMSLIVDYRTFASAVVYRLNKGALNYEGKNKFTILVCIDELDKIVDFEEIRAFIRRIKAIFEIPGLYYYISIAEDTLRSLYLGATTGKTEIDSAFDHIVRVPALPCYESESVARAYLQKNLEPMQLPARICRLIAALAFGIPRDIIRRCDEFIQDVIEESNREVVNSPTPYGLVRKVRLRQLNLAYELQQLSSEQIAALAGSPADCASAAREMIRTVRSKEPTARLVLLVWVLALAEIAVETANDQNWERISEGICNYGYKLSDAPFSDLITQIKELSDSFLVAKVPTSSNGSPEKTVLAKQL
jgi:hypothetical protein